MPFIADTFHLRPRIIGFLRHEGEMPYRCDCKDETELPDGWLIYVREDGEIFDKILLKHGINRGWRKWVGDDLLAARAHWSDP